MFVATKMILLWKLLPMIFEVTNSHVEMWARRKSLMATAGQLSGHCWELSVQ